jgi:hypothetical protein
MDLKMSDKQIWKCGLIIFSTEIVCTLLCLIFNPRHPDSVHKYAFIVNGIKVYLTGFECLVIYGLFILTGVLFYLFARAILNKLRNK